MNSLTVDALTPEQTANLVAICGRWREYAFSTERIDRPKLASAVTDLYRELSLAEPREFLYFPSPGAALRASGSWQARTGHVAQFLWDYQLPLFDPTSYWRRHSKSPDLDLAIVRKPNQHRCYCFGEALPVMGKVLEPGAHSQIWNTVVTCLGEADWCSSLVETLEDDPVMGALAERVGREDPTSQAWPRDYLTLGPMGWLLREVAALEFAQTALGCRVNDRLTQAEMGLIMHGSLLFTFEHLVVAIERPRRFENSEPVYAES